MVSYLYTVQYIHDNILHHAMKHSGNLQAQSSRDHLADAAIHSYSIIFISYLHSSNTTSLPGGRLVVDQSAFNPHYPPPLPACIVVRHNIDR